MLGSSGRLTGLPLPPQDRGMEPQVNLRVTCRGETQSFLVSDSAHTTWADVEAMVKVSFDLDNIQIKYIDEDDDEVSVNSREEYEEALKIAVRQGNQLQMNVYEENSSLKETSYSCSLQLHEKTVTEKLTLTKDEKKPLLHYSMLAQGLEEDIKNEKELTIQQKLNHTRKGRTNENPPEWFTSYLETFREQVVKETVEKLEQKLYEKLVHHSQPPDFSESSITAAPPTSESQPGNGNQCDWLISCCNCQARIVGVRYQCSLCPAYNICEQCEAGTYAHDPNHVLLKLRRPVLCIAENYSLAEFSSRLPATLEQVRLQKQMDKRFLKAEKQRLRAEKKQRKAEVRELKKQLKLHRKINLWNSVHVLETNGSPALKSESLQPNTFLPRSPSQPFQAVVPTLSAVFVDENLPDGTHLQPGTKFIKHWRMKNTGNVEWSSDTKLKLMWGNLTLASSEKKDVLVPSLPSGQVGTVSVEFVAPNIEGTYTSHWRLSHRGEQFGPRIWCSIVVDPSPATDYLESNWKDSDSFLLLQDASLKTEAGAQLMGEIMEQAEIPLPTIPLKIKNLPSEREFYIPSVDLLTAQDLLSFELLDINIVQELERVPHNTPVDMTPCMSPLPHESPLLEKPGLGQIEEENEGSGFKPVPGMTEACFPADTCRLKVKAEHPLNQEEGEEDMSGTQFVCETVIRSLTLDAAPDHKPPQKKKILQNSLQTLQDTFSCSMINEESSRIKSNFASKKEAKSHQSEAMTENDCGDLPLSDERPSPCSDTGNSDEEEEDDDKDDVQSQGSSASSEDYIIILPECFDTSRPLGESMYSSALSQPSLEKRGEPETGAEHPEGGSQLQIHSVSDTLTTSQTLAIVPLTPEIADTLPQTQRNLASLQNRIFQEPNISALENISSTPHHQIREDIDEPSGKVSHGPGSSGFLTSKQKCSEYPRYPQGSSIAGELVKGALSVAASAYKALFAGPPIIQQQPAATEEHTATLLSSLCEMGFCDRQLNLRLLKKHNNNMVQVVTELLQITNSDWYSSRC
ncbi:next to BRCA1 gene 1 protein isoform X3 [Haliaeetus albicilla]|uniref:next to BRCA1 gene 1 protein isoform X3 n=1 Tax=Haliaeetus albicilla TaxID=8969 RepID=UPI0037E90840